MNDVQVAMYARVSCEQQSEAKTIESQLSELRAYISRQGLSLPTEHEFIDDGYSGATLIRPALEQLRDVVAAGGLDRLFVLCPDRLARNYAHQVLLLEEFLRAGLEVNFLNREVGFGGLPNQTLGGWISNIFGEDAAPSEALDESGAVTQLVVGDQIVIRSDQSAQILTEINIDGRTVIERAYAYVQDLPRSFVCLSG